MSNVLYFIFGDARHQNDDDLEDLCQNIKQFDSNAKIIINHPFSNHPYAKIKHIVQPVNSSQFIFGAFVDLLAYLKNYNCDFDHLCLVSANQYFIGSFSPIKGINYIQFYNCENWSEKYNGKNFSNLYVGNPLIQPYGVWDSSRICDFFGIENPMASNWESAYLTKKTVRLCIENIDKCIELFPDKDLMSIYPGYMALKSNQPWQFPPFFGTFDPSNKINNFNYIITEEQVKKKMIENYCVIKRVNYSKECPIKNFIRTL